MSYRYKPADEDFWAKVERTESCWLWVGYLRHDGYGQSLGWPVHRISYLTLVGPIPDGLVLDHLCRVRNCVNPAHLEPVTRGENARRGEPANRTHCPAGHEYSPENTRRYGDRRFCRACNAAAQRRRQQRLREERAS